MTEEPAASADAQHHQPPRRTSEGRVFGSISYAAEEEQQIEDLRRRPSIRIPHVTDEHWMDGPSRSTGARRSAS